MNPSLVSIDTKVREDGTVATEASSTVCTNKEPSVQFVERADVQLIPRLDTYTEDEMKDIWYSPEEYARIEKGVVEESARMHRGEVLKDKKYCSRGIDKYLPLNYLASKGNSRKAFELVFQEQDRQYQKQVCDDEAIARVYRNVSSSCAMWANVIGLRDQKEAESYIDDDDDDI